MTALDSDEIEVRSIQSTEDLNARVPGVAVNGGNFFGRATGAFRVRGVPGVAFYVDGVVRSAAEGLLMNVVDVERVEVLRVRRARRSARTLSAALSSTSRSDRASRPRRTSRPRWAR